jgi:hypothetical protein
MKERDDKCGGATVVVVGLVLLLLLVPVLYALSVGPVIWLATHGYISKDGNYYAPIQWVCDHCEPFDQAMDWYIGLFN